MSKNFGHTFDAADAPTEHRKNVAEASNDNVPMAMFAKGKG